MFNACYQCRVDLFLEMCSKSIYLYEDTFHLLNYFIYFAKILKILKFFKNRQETSIIMSFYNILLHLVRLG